MMQPFKPYSLNLKGQLVTIDHPWVMGDYAGRGR